MEDKKIMSPQLKGLIISLFVIIVSIGGYFTELSFQPWFGWVVNGLFFLAIIFACIHFATQKDGYVTFGNVFVHGFKITAVITVILLAYTILSMTVLFPEMKDKIFEMQEAKMEEQGIDSDKIEAGMKFMKDNFMLFMVIFLIFGNLIIGCIASLIGAAVAKKKPINPFTQQGGM
jgi:hypothetical protein